MSRKDINVELHEKFGVIVSFDDANLADEFDDFLVEKYYVLYEMREIESKNEFLFGYASSLSRVQSMLDEFKKLM